LLGFSGIRKSAHSRMPSSAGRARHQGKHALRLNSLAANSPKLWLPVAFALDAHASRYSSDSTNRFIPAS
jgi:hypothetical protein